MCLVAVVIVNFIGLKHRDTLQDKLCTVTLTSSTLPQADGRVRAKEHVQHVLDVVGDLEAEPHAHDGVPGGAKLLVHGVLDHLGRTLVVGAVLLAGRHAQLHGLNPHLLIHV